MGKFEGKTVLVTGGSSGIGRATALAFAGEGANVVVADISAERGHEIVEAIKAKGGKAMFVKTDVSKHGEVKALIEKTVGAYGRLDCAFNNAGIQGEYANTADCSEENWDGVLNTNLKGEWLCMKYEILEMLKQGHGSIVNASSMAGLRGYPTIPAYSAAKWGIIGLTKSAAIEYAKNGIRINAVCPGCIPTAMPALALSDPETKAKMMEPMGRLGDPEDIAEAVMWLCSDATGYVTGHALAVDGGLTI